MLPRYHTDTVNESYHQITGECKSKINQLCVVF